MNNPYEEIENNLRNVKARIKRAAEKSGQKPEDIALVAVTKTVAPERIKALLSLGVCDLGENRVQEMCGKYDILYGMCRWHLIGRLQTNKVKYILDKVSLIHSVDRLALADELQKRAEKLQKQVDILVQVNVSGELSKAGIEAGNALAFLKELSYRENLKVRGLMTIAPYFKNPEDTRYVFRRLRKLFIDIKEENINNIDMDYLSMGMSNDFEIAIEEGSNMVRIGTAIFGPRLTH